VREQTHSLTGVWKLVAFDVEYQDTGERKATYGSKPRGYLALLPEGRMIAVIAAEKRKVPETNDDRAAAFRTMLAYSGVYRLEGDKWITKVDVAWNEAWTGTDQVRYFTFDGALLTVSTGWQLSANEAGRNIRATLTWERDSSAAAS
jgi:hypothetical protein